MQKAKPNSEEPKTDRRPNLCLKAPEWAEHARFDEEDEPCEDGRSGIFCGNREGEKPCSL